MLATCWLAFTPAPPSALDTGWDKANHALCFAVLAFVALRGFPAGRWRFAAIAGALIAFGVFIELVQSQIPGRDADALDVLADCAGLLPILVGTRMLRL